MDGCKYCKVEPNGDIPDDLGQLIVWEGVINVEEKAETEAASVYIHTKTRVSCDVEVTRNELCLFIDPEDTDTYTLMTAPINFCPMCGRKLHD